MRLAIYLSSFTLNLTQDSNDPYPWLSSVTPLTIAARAGTPQGLGVNESSNMTAIIDNVDNQYTNIVRNSLRCRAELYDDDNRLAFEGVISKSNPGPVVSLEIDG